MSLPHAAFLDAVARLQAEGLAVEQSPEEAWRQFRFWRAQYEEAASVLAAFVVAPAAPWSGEGRG